MICQATFMDSPSTAVNIDEYFFGSSRILPSWGGTRAIFAVAEYIPGFRVFLHAKAMHRRLVGKLNDLVALHDVETNAAHPCSTCRLRKIAAVIGPVREEGRMVCRSPLV